MLYRTRVKFCGITRLEDIQKAVELGVDALGFILYPKSKRALSVEELKPLIHAVPVWVSSVVLLVNSLADEVNRVIEEVRPDYLQFHGDETVEFCEQFNYPYIRAIRVGAPGLSTPEEIAHSVAAYKQAKAFIFDAYSPEYGGTGISFDADLLNVVRTQQAREKIIIAGDFNTEPHCTTLYEQLKAFREKESVLRSKSYRYFYNPSWCFNHTLPPCSTLINSEIYGTYFYKNKKNIRFILFV